MPLFRKKTSDESDGATDFTPDPAKAAKWFEHAGAMADSHQYASALVYYAHGLQLDPGSISAQQAVIALAPRHRQEGGKRLSKEIKKLDGPRPIDKLAAAILAWTSEFGNAALGVKVIEAAAKADQFELANQWTRLVLEQILVGKKVNRNLLLQLKDAASACNDWDNAMNAARAALNLDPSDSKLDEEIKEFTAQQAMEKMGPGVGKEGGFRDNIRDRAKQQQLVQEDSLAGVGGARESVLERARAAYEESPEVPDVLNRYAQLLRREGTPEAIATAERVYRNGFEATGEYRFRMNAGDLAIGRLRAKLADINAQFKTADESDRASLKERVRAIRTELLDLEAAEYAERSEKYPTDRTLKFRLGEVAFRRGDNSTAMENFQKAKDEPKLRTAAGHALGRCFAREEWHGEAIAEFRETLEKIDAGDSDREMEIRYDLMLSLIMLARIERSGEDARDALELCSWIARKDITYRDIRDRRKEIDQLVRDIG